MKRPWALPLVPLYAAGAALRRIGMKPKRLAWPVISVGSLSAGGAGKTPFVIALAQLLKREGSYVDVLSRGYGRVGTTVERVDPEGDAEQFGDEPLLIAREAAAPVFVGAQRFDAGNLAESEAKAGIHLLDDGFQHEQLYRDVDILILNKQDWFEDSLLPAGNLRESRRAVHRATVVAASADEPEIEENLHRTIALDRGSEGPYWYGPVWRFRREMDIPKIDGAVVAFCGIARPEQFFAGLEGAGVQIVGRHVFRDHHRFEERDLELLRKLVLDTGAVGLVTTTKDSVRLGVLEEKLQQTVPVHTAGLRTVFEDEAGITAWLKVRLRS